METTPESSFGRRMTYTVGSTDPLPGIMDDIDDVLSSFATPDEKIAWLRSELGKTLSLAEGWGGYDAWSAGTEMLLNKCLTLLLEAKIAAKHEGVDKTV